jgi:hypothetical protein
MQHLLNWYFRWNVKQKENSFQFSSEKWRNTAATKMKFGTKTAYNIIITFCMNIICKSDANTARVRVFRVRFMRDKI